MASYARQAIRTGYTETTGTISRMVPTLLLICITTVVLGGVDDHVLLSGGEVNTPLVGQTRYELFMVIAPGMIVVMRTYLDLQFSHLGRLERVMRHYKIRRPVSLTGNNNAVLAVAGLIAIHITPVATMAFLARQVSAVYPQMAIVLFAVAAGLALMSGWALFDRTRPVRIALGVGLPIAMIVGGSFVLHNKTIQASGAFGETSSCILDEDTLYGQFAAAYFRPVDAENRTFIGQKVQQKHMVCGNLNHTIWHRADLREALLNEADMREAEFHYANVGGAIFHNAALRQAKFHFAIAHDSFFHNADLTGASFEEATLLFARFVSGSLTETAFQRAKIDHSNFWKAQIGRADFSGSQIRVSTFIDALIFDATFNRAQLTRVDFFNATLENIDFAGAKLTGVSFEEARLNCIDFEGAELIDIDFSGVDPHDLRTVRLNIGAVATGKSSDGAAPSVSEDQAALLRITWPEGDTPPADLGADFDTECGAT